MDKFIAITAVVAVIVVLSLILSLPVMWLWNGALVGALAGVNQIGWLQAWGISLLANILFKNVSTD